MDQEPSLSVTNAISVDVEDYFHPSEVQQFVDPADWARLPSRVERTTQEVLDLFSRHDVKATFFVLGWVARHYPALVRTIREAGHDIGCHSFAHRIVYEMTPAEFLADTEAAQAAISDACGVMPRSYRAPSYSITSKSLWALDILAECGFTHDSSIYPVSHDRYGIPGFNRHAHVLETGSGRIIEVPIASVKLSDTRVSPVGGGAYLRLLPYRYTAAGIRRINEEEQQPACVYFHPWEIDPAQPRLARGFISRLRTYAGISGMKSKLDRLLRDFQFSSLAAVYPHARYIEAPRALSGVERAT